MKPKDLKSQYTWDTRCIKLEDGVFYVPSHYPNYGSFTFPGWAHSDVFGNENPVNVEYCSGNGAWIATKAMEFPNENWVAVEKRFDRVRKIWSKKKNHGLNNLFIVCGEAQTFTEHYIPKGSVKDIFINFPDPWPKKRHAKHRLMQSDFVDMMGQVIKKEGALTLVTDDPDYSIRSTDVLLQHDAFESLYPMPFYQTSLTGYGSSYFDALWRQKGRQIRYHRYRKTVNSAAIS